MLKSLVRILIDPLLLRLGRRYFYLEQTQKNPKSNAVTVCQVHVDENSVVRRLPITKFPNCRLNVDKNSTVEASIAFERPGAVVAIGARSFINGTLVVSTSITIGNDVMTSWGVTIVDHDSHSSDFELRKNDVMEWGEGRKDWTHVKTKPVLIGDKCWIGFNSIILKGVHLGEGVIVAAGSVVTKDVAPWTLVAGNPAKPIRGLPREVV